MKIKLKIKQTVIIAIVIMIFAGMQSGSIAGNGEQKPKSETVYAILDNDGTYTGATVVNCFSQHGQITDYGTYTSIRNLTGPDDPQVDGDKITWPAQITQEAESFYYEGETDKSLPFDIDIKYRLNGEETPAEQIAGKTGELIIDFDLHNSASSGETDALTGKQVYTPFAVTVSITLDKDVFTIKDIPSGASAMTVGSSQTVTYSSFPLPDDSFSITLFGKIIALEPINIMAMPKAPPGLDSYGDFVDVDEMSEGTDDMMDGTDEMSDGANKLQDGLYEMRDAADEMQTGLEQLSDGAVSLENGTDALAASAKTLSNSVTEFYTGLSEFAASFAVFDEGIGDLATNVTAMSATLAGLSDVAAQLDTGVIGIGNGLDGIAASNANLVTLANTVATTYPDADTAALLAGLNLQQAAMDGLAASGDDLEVLSGSVQTGTQAFYSEFSTTFLTSVLTLQTSSNTLYASCLDLLSGAEKIKEGCQQLSSAANSVAHGADDIKSGAAEAADGVPALIDAIDDMIDGVADLQEGISTLSEEGLQEMKDSLDGLDEYLEKISKKADEYGSFMDERNAKTSSVQFVLKTKGIEIEE